MANFLSNMTIGKRISLAIIIPIIGIVLLSAKITFNNYDTYSKTQELTEVVNIIAELNALTHKLQVERGRTAAYIGSGERQTPSSLSEARQKIDGEMSNYTKLIAHFKTIISGEMVADVSALEKKLSSLAEYRSRVDSGSVDAGENITYYSDIIEKIFKLGFISAELSTNSNVALSTIAMLNLGEAKEYAGRERGLIAGALSKQEITTLQYEKFRESISIQDRLTENFIASEPEQYRAKYRKLIDESGIAEVVGIRKKISEHKTDISKSGIKAEDWFSSTTTRINNLRKLEIKASDDLLKQANKISDNSFNEMLLSLLASVVVGAVATLAGFIVSGSITKPLNNLSKSMRDISEGQLETDIIGQDMNNEIGDMSRTLVVFRDNAVEKRGMDEEAKTTAANAEAKRVAKDERKAKEAEETRRIVDTLGAAMVKLSEGDLSVRINEEFGQGLDGLRTAFHSAVEQLSSTLDQVKLSAESVQTNSSEMRGATDLLSRRTEEQAKSLQEASAAIEEITATVKQSAGDAQSASEKSKEAKQSTEVSREVVENAISSMSRIEDASKQIASIIGVIDEISFQTNLLALNAGVEAARAGDSGKGFAVVAQEVRELAQRSTEAAQDIKNLIETSSREVDEGVKNVTATGEALNSISDHVGEIADFISSIAVATEEQSVGLEECNKSVNDLDASTQQNAAMAEETTAVTNQLAGDANELSRLIARFKTEDGNSEANRYAA